MSRDISGKFKQKDTRSQAINIRKLDFKEMNWKEEMPSFDTEKGTIHREDKFKYQRASFSTRQMNSEKTNSKN